MLKLNTEKFLYELNRLWTNKNCPMCSQNRWNVDNNLVTTLGHTIGILKDVIVVMVARTKPSLVAFLLILQL